MKIIKPFKIRLASISGVTETVIHNLNMLNMAKRNLNLSDKFYNKMVDKYFVKY